MTATARRPESAATLVLDLRCLQDDNRFHGIGTYARSVLDYAQREAPQRGLRVEGCFFDWLGRLRSLPVETLRVDELPRGLHVQGLFLSPRFRRRYSEFWFSALARRKVWVHFMDQNNCPYRYSGRAVVTVHDVAPAIPSPWATNPAHVAVERRYLAGVLGWARQVVTVSEFSRTDLARRFGIDPTLVRVIQPPVAAKPSDAAWPRPPHFLYVGGLDARKNPDRLIEAFLRFRRTHGTAYRLRLVGSHHREDVTRLTRTFGAREGWAQVDLVGYLSPAELTAAMDASLALVFVTLFEGFGYPPVEAMARGLPVIASTTGSLPEVVGDAGLLVDPADPEAIASAMATVARDDDARTRLIARGRARAAALGGDEPLRQLFALYATCLAADTRPAAAREAP